MWNYTRILENQGCEIYRIKPILGILNKPEVEATSRDYILSSLGFVGPDGLLSGLRNSFVFDQVREEEFQGKRVYVFGGTWKDTQIVVGPGGMKFNRHRPAAAALHSKPGDGLSGQGRQVAVSGDLRGPHPVADGKEEGRARAGTMTVDRWVVKTTAVGGRPTKITLTYSNVVLNSTVLPELFRSPLIDNPLPKNSAASDITEKLTNDVDQAVTRMAAIKKAEAAKAAPPLGRGLAGPRAGRRRGGAVAEVRVNEP